MQEPQSCTGARDGDHSYVAPFSSSHQTFPPCAHKPRSRAHGCSAEVPIGGSLEALKKLEAKLGIDLTSGAFETAEWTSSKL